MVTYSDSLFFPPHMNTSSFIVIIPDPKVATGGDWKEICWNKWKHTLYTVYWIVNGYSEIKEML